MIRTIIVEDEFYIRRGLIHSLPWEAFGMEIIGEADNGESALELLAQLDADLVITDLTMPVMSGIELMRRLSTTRPDLPVAVLTCHRDFDYIQEALRLGAIDYMVKTKLESMELEESLSRISDRIHQMNRNQPTRSAGWIWMNRSGTSCEALERLKSQYALVPHPSHSFLAYMPEAHMDHMLKDTLLSSDLILLIVEGLGPSDWANYSAHLVDFIQGPFFYRYEPSLAEAVTVTLQEVLEQSNKQSSKRLTRFKDIWQSFSWLFSDSLWEEWLQLVREEQPAPKQLKTMLHSTYEEWSHASILKQEQYLPLLSGEFYSWSEYRAVLDRTRLHLQQQLGKQPYSQDIVLSALRSLPVITELLPEGLSQNLVAQKVNMSRGYFSQVFKDTLGLSFNDYVKEYSLSIAKRYLQQNEYPIYWIAEQAGFKDERYFSRLFRQQTGVLPSEYRSQHKEK
ncbi:response regulator [Paenibacillus sp. GCM10023252]|uniref:response regulator transcription factor n=1 Tax=Paenibacillus sp. GCM10023252 TaxID=3252649 RepID=UPI00361CEBD5